MYEYRANQNMDEIYSIVDVIRTGFQKGNQAFRDLLCFDMNLTHA